MFIKVDFYWLAQKYELCLVFENLGQKTYEEYYLFHLLVAGHMLFIGHLEKICYSI